MEVPWRGGGGLKLLSCTWSKPAILSNFGRHVFGNFTVEANMQRHEVPYRLSSKPNRLDLE